MVERLTKAGITLPTAKEAKENYLAVALARP
jgi:hypothetical protein